MITGFDKKLIEEVLNLYLSGATVYEICDYFNLGDGIINEIIDTYAQHL